MKSVVKKPSRLCQIIRRRRLKMGIKQKELAQRARIHASFLCALEKGSKVASIKTLKPILRALKIPVEWAKVLSVDAAKVKAKDFEAGEFLVQTQRLMLISLQLQDLI